MNIQFKKTGEATTRLDIVNDVPILRFPNLEATNIVDFGFSTRMGGVSEGIYESMNLSYVRGDKKEAVDENYRRISEALEMPKTDFVGASQTHTTVVRQVTSEDRGKGFTRPRDYEDVDGLMTNVEGLVLVTVYADCVPLFFVDPVHKVIAASHAGWRGTVDDMAGVTVARMAEVYGSKPEEIAAAIGPSICKDCYEVGAEVAEAFKQAYPMDICKDILMEKSEGKYQLDLWKANKYAMIRAGILPEHIAVTDICTACNSELMWSHRKSMGKRGNLAAFIRLKRS